MAQMTPEQLITIVGMAVSVFLLTEAWRERARWLPWLAVFWNRYFVVRIPDRPSAPDAPGTSGAARADAVRDGAPGASTAPNMLIGGALEADLVALLQRIAGHKVHHPTDMKVATAKALGIAKSGSSEAYRRFSAAWDLLYPPPPDPPIRSELVGERADRIRREETTPAA